MEKPYLLHLFTPTPQASPFDVNMAYDAGYTAVIPYTGVSLADIGNLTQDAIFSRGPKGVRRTGIFIGGREIGLAADMLPPESANRAHPAKGRVASRSHRMLVPCRCIGGARGSVPLADVAWAAAAGGVSALSGWIGWVVESGSVGAFMAIKKSMGWHVREALHNPRDARSGSKRDGWRACWARRVPGGTRKPTGASDARFGPNPGGPWFCGRCASLRIQASRPGLPWISRLAPHPAKTTPRTARVVQSFPRLWPRTRFPNDFVAITKSPYAYSWPHIWPDGGGCPSKPFLGWLGSTGWPGQFPARRSSNSC